MYRRFTHYSLILGITFLLASCGFHLRGMGNAGASIPQAWKNMHLVTGSPNGEFSRAVTAQLAANGVQWSDGDNASFDLMLGPENFEQRSLSVNSEARVAEYELTMSSEFSILDPNRKEIVPPTTVTVVKQMENDPRNVVGKESEIRLIKGEMRTDLAQQITRRISFYAASIIQAETQQTDTPQESPPENP
ncbi:LPS-assembly lipoprotein LptE [Halioglobus japonicus]|nr:LPS-assembly lipoprotein LptE [Halioglobus japonicus]